MTTTLYDLTYSMARRMYVVRRGTATGGSTTTIIDTVERTEADDYWERGGAWIVYDAAGAGAAPEGEFSVISASVLSTNTINLSTALTAGVSSGDHYAVTSKHFPLNMMINAVNNSLDELRYREWDTTSLTTAANQTEYSLPVVAKAKLLNVYVQTNKDSNDNLWKPIPHRVKQSDAGTAGTLILDVQPESGYALALEYAVRHDPMNVSTDKLHESIPLERVLYPSILECYWWKKTETMQDIWDAQVVKWEKECTNIEQLYPIDIKPPPIGRFISQTHKIYYPGDRTNLK